MNGVSNCSVLLGYVLQGGGRCDVYRLNVAGNGVEEPQEGQGDGRGDGRWEQSWLLNVRGPVRPAGPLRPCAPPLRLICTPLPESVGTLAGAAIYCRCCGCRVVFVHYLSLPHGDVPCPSLGEFGGKVLSSRRSPAIW